MPKYKIETEIEADSMEAAIAQVGAELTLDIYEMDPAWPNCSVGDVDRFTVNVAWIDR